MPAAAAKAENTYVVAPQSPGDHFPVRPAQEIMRKALAAGLNQGHLLEVRAAKQPSEPYSAELTKPLADSIRDKLKGVCAAGAPFPLTLLASSFPPAPNLSPFFSPSAYPASLPHPANVPRAAICPDRYKLFVQVVVAENKGQGLRVASRALWDASTDVLASETISTDNVVAVATCHAVYMP